VIRHFETAVVLASACIISTGAVVSRANAEGKFDGTWSAVLYTTSGACAPSISSVVRIENGIVYVVGVSPTTFSGRVSPTGVVSVTASMGGIYGVANGRLASQSGGGVWRAQMQNAPCSGTWSAQRN
jgi:hypothetical protein